MIDGKRIVVVLPACNAQRTLARTCAAIDREIVDDVVLVDDASDDATVPAALELGLPVYRHRIRRGYGGNQKTCYQAALDRGADVVGMLHPDDQYPAELVPALAAMVASGAYEIAIGSRMLSGDPCAGGMPRYKYLSNRLWTWAQNRCLGQRLSEYHTGFRAYSRRLLLTLPLLQNSDDFVFDNQLLVQAVCFGFRIGELSTPARFTEDSSSISPWRGTWYGLGVALTSAQFLAHRAGVIHCPLFDPLGYRLTDRVPEPEAAVASA